MTEFLEKIENVLMGANPLAIVEDDFLQLLACGCVANGLKSRHYKKVVQNTIVEKMKCRVVYSEDQLEDMYDEAKESKPNTTLHCIEKYLKEYKNVEIPVGIAQDVKFEKNPIHSIPKYIELKKHFETTEGWCKFNHPAFYGKVFKTADGTQFEKEDNPKTYFENKEFSITSKNDDKPTTKWFNFFDLWKKDPEIKTFDRIVFDPSRSNPKDLNLFSDYCSIANNKNVKEVSISRVLEHIKSICGYDEACYEYFLNYTAHTIQKPEQHNDVAVVMYGREGVGKNIILQLIGDVIGSQYYGESSEPRDLFGQFATGMYKKIMFVYDESDKKDTTGFMNRLKTLVTGRKLRVELKGKDSFEVDNYCRLFFPTNNTQPFPITKGNRRWFYLKSSNKYVQLPDKERFDYFDSLAKHFKDPNVIYSFYKFLSTRDISHFNSNNFPKSEGLQQAMQIPLILRCFHTCILNHTGKASMVYQSSELLKILINYCKDNNYTSSAYNPTTLGTELQEYIDNGCIHKKRLNSGIRYQFDIENFSKYIKQHGFNLDDISTSNDNATTEKIYLQIEEHRKIIQELKRKLVNECNVVMGEDPLLHGIEPLEKKGNPTLHYTAPKKDYSKRILPTSEPTVLSKVDSTIFSMSFD